jgi:Mor family transcriptional regulator
MAELVGSELALKLADQFGGISYYVPSEPRPAHPWAALLGPEAWAKVCASYGGGQLRVPRGTFRDLKKVTILELAEQGLSHREIARRVRASDVYVHKVVTAGGINTRGVRRRLREDRNLKLPGVE